MSSILTNIGAMTALQTLKMVNSNLEKTQSEISTGKSIATAKDDAAIFAISKVMESDVAGFEAVSGSLALGQSTVAVAANGAEKIGELLNEIKSKVVKANEDNQDRGKLQNEIDSLRGQIGSIVGSAQFNGLNLIDGSTDGTAGFSVLSSLNRDSDGSVTTSSIQFDPTDTNLSTASGTDLINTGGANPATSETVTAAIAAVDEGLTSAQIATDATKQGFSLDGSTTTAQFGTFSAVAADGSLAAAGTPLLRADQVDDAPATATDGLIAGDKITVAVGNTVATYTTREGDDGADIVAGLRTALLDAGIDQSKFTLDTTTNAGDLTITNNSELAVNGYYQITRASGGLAGLDTIDVSTQAGAASALTQMETFIQNAVDAQAQLGTTSKRLEIQNDFMSSQIDSFKAGIGSLVDANMEEASARLQALQTQQQLGIQALSIANSAPQNILALFR